MKATTPEFEAACKTQLDKFFAVHHDAAMQKQAMKALRMLRASENPLKGKPEEWAAGIIYAVANDGKIPFGVPEFLNADFEKFMGVTMSTAKTRAARVMEIVIF